MIVGLPNRLPLRMIHAPTIINPHQRINSDSIGGLLFLHPLLPYNRPLAPLITKSIHAIGVMPVPYWGGLAGGERLDSLDDPIL